MKVKFTFLALFICLFVGAQAQNSVINGDLETWTGNAPDGWSIVDGISPESTTIHGGSFAAKHTSGESSLKFQQVVDVEAGTTYTISYWYYDNDATARTRIWSYWVDASGATLTDDEEVLRPNAYSADEDAWQQFSAELTAPMGAAKFRFEVRVYKQDGNFGGAVFYDDFVFSGDVVVNPEPTNYPTNFAAEIQDLGIALEWVDATGSQLPNAYLVLASTGSITVPQDGTPVANNLTSGTLAYNVAYGVGEFAFGNLSANTTYNFAIFPYTNYGTSIDYKTDGSYPTVQMTTANLMSLLYEHFDDELGVMTAFDALGDQGWTQSVYNDDTFAKMSGYSSGSAYDNEDWLISPNLHTNTNLRTALLSFRTAYSFDGNPLKMMISTDYAGGEPTDYSWDDISDAFDWSDGSYNWVESGNVDIIDYYNASSKLYIAFLYTSTSSAASTWEIDYVRVIGEPIVGISENETNKVFVYPNPATNNIQFTLDQNAKVSVLDLTGRIIASEQVYEGTSKLDVSNLANGMYIIKFEYQDGTSTSNKFSKK